MTLTHKVVASPLITTGSLTLAEELFQSAGVRNAMLGVTVPAIADGGFYRRITPKQLRMTIGEIREELALVQQAIRQAKPFENAATVLAPHQKTLHKLGLRCLLADSGYEMIIDPSFLSQRRDTGEPVFGVIPHTEREAEIRCSKYRGEKPTVEFRPTLPTSLTDHYANTVEWLRSEIGYQPNTTGHISIFAAPLGFMTADVRKRYETAVKSPIFNNQIFIAFDAVWKKERNITIVEYRDPLILGLVRSAEFNLAGDVYVLIDKYNPTPWEELVAKSWTTPIR